MIDQSFRPDHVASGVHCLTTCRSPGVSKSPYDSNNLALHVGDDPLAVSANRQILQTAIHCNRIQWLTQVHGTTCFQADSATAAQAPRADAIWTDQRRLGLAVLSADCVPVVLWTLDGTRVGVAHAGWRGLIDGVLTNLVTAMAVPDTKLEAWIGPGISQVHYQVGADVAARLSDQYGSSIQPESDSGRFRADLPALAHAQLQSLGVVKIQHAGVCTFADPRCFSYRRDGLTGRMATLIWRE